MGDGRIFLKTSVPLSLMTIYRMSLISAWSTSLDITFKGVTYRYLSFYTQQSNVDLVETKTCATVH